MTEHTNTTLVPPPGRSPSIDAAVVTLCERHADRALILAQRLLEAITHAPEIEEDMALSNLALDLIGQARSLYTYAGLVEARLTGSTSPRTEDDFAYWRDQHEFKNPLLVEQPNGDFAHIIVRQFLHDAYATAWWEAMTVSADSALAAIAARAVKESRYHLRHSREWVLRLGDGTEESNRRAQDALDRLWRYTGELFDSDQVEITVNDAAIAPLNESLAPLWTDLVDDTLSEATLVRPVDMVMQTGGWTGRHTEGFSYLVGELQVVARAHPGASW